MVKELTIALAEMRLTIDRTDMDKAVTEQPDLYREIGMQHAFARERLSEAKHDVKVVEARLGRDCAEDMNAEGLKVTRDAVREAVTMHPDSIDAHRAVRLAELEVDRWLVLREAAKERSYALSNLTTLIAHSYSANSSTKAGDDWASKSIRAEDARKGMHAKRVPPSELRKRVNARRKGKKRPSL